ncbi:ABC transporter ATP-binding protein [Virgibacillus halophilus]|uniref:ABC transporter ATP-binding protein n=1 Tax=Tigheibacillus halophilus TaxID=361280 RepID=A0ABU5CAX3_9BACI|nr:ABC transporter ATP-binding protein [Virgibacillus halophilus]
MIEFKHVSKIYNDGTQALDDFTLQVHDAELVTLIGPSGCGKTTTMKMINRLINPTSGDIYINGNNIKNVNIHELRFNIGYVLQEIALFPHMTIEENIAVVPEMKKWKRKRIRDRSHALMEMVGLDPSVYARRMPNELSGGQQQRVGVIRALAADPDIILMDEPFSALDPISREQLQDDIQKLQKQIKKTIVFVTHDMEEALALGDRVCLMKDGKIVQADTPQSLILQPKSQFVKDFIGNRKSPWQAAVDTIAKQLDDNLLHVSEAVEPSSADDEKYYVLHDDSGAYAGMIHAGKRMNIEPLQNNTKLAEASDKLQTSGLDFLPVVKNGYPAGLLGYQDIVSYLKQHAADRSGVADHE